MIDKYTLFFKEKVKDQINKFHDKKDITTLINKMLDKMEILGQHAGNLIDNKRSLYEIKMKSPPLRLYYQVIEHEKKILVFEFEMKTSPKKQKKTINKLKKEIDKSNL